MYVANEKRYESITYNRLGNSGLFLPVVSLGMWHNFGDNCQKDNMLSLLTYAFDHGITHFDLANNYGPPYGSAELNFGELFFKYFKSYRDEIIISTKAGYDMWPGPYGNWGSKKYLIASLNQSLKRLKLDYVDIFYHHRMDPNTSLEETMQALAYAVNSGKALYVGLSNYDGKTLKEATVILKELHVPFVINQNRYSILDRSIEKNGLKEMSYSLQKGIIAFSPLAQGMLTSRYLDGFSQDSRALKDGRYLKQDTVKANLEKIKALNEIAKARGQTLAQMALAWVLKDHYVASVLIGASKVSQIEENLKATENTSFTEDELNLIDRISLS